MSDSGSPSQAMQNLTAAAIGKLRPDQVRPSGKVRLIIARDMSTLPTGSVKFTDSVPCTSPTHARFQTGAIQIPKHKSETSNFSKLLPMKS